MLKIKKDNKNGVVDLIGLTMDEFFTIRLALVQAQNKVYNEVQINGYEMSPDNKHILKRLQCLDRKIEFENNHE